MSNSRAVDVAVAISANSEWKAALAVLLPREEDIDHGVTPFGPSFQQQRPGYSARFFLGGWGKVAAASSTQYAIDCWRPRLLVNLGTCGGFSGVVQRGEILLVEETLLYDIHERMFDPQAAIRHYATAMDLSWLPEKAPSIVRRACLPSADQDLNPADITFLREQYGAIAVDWESGAIAWVASRNQVRCLILRGVSDLVSPDGGEAYTGEAGIFERGAHQVMETLLGSLDGWVAAALPPVNG